MNPQTLPTVTFESLEIEKEIKSAHGLIDYVVLTTLRIAKEYDAMPRRIKFTWQKCDELMTIYLNTRVLELSPVFAEFWVADIKDTKTVLEHMIAHEIGHYIIDKSLPGSDRDVWLDMEERYADAFAQKITGLGRAEAEGLIDAINDAILGR